MVFFHGTSIFGADAETFKLIGNFYAVDKNFVYYRDQILDGQDPETFIINNGSEDMVNNQ